MSRITYEEGGPELFSRVGPLWERLRAHHEGISLHFPKAFKAMKFPARKKELLNKGRKNGLRIFLAYDAEEKRDAGYSVATIDPLRTAELDSLYVDDTYRGKRIGETLTRKALKWIRGKKPKATNIFVAVGNERALNFYGKFKFQPYTLQLHRKD